MRTKLFFVALVLCLTTGGAEAQNNSGDLAIIVGKDRALDNVTADELTKIFRADKSKGADGVRFILTARDAGAPERAAALAGIYEMSEDDYAKYFLQATFTGLVQSAPRSFASPAAVRQFVAGTPGAIGYLRASDVDDSVKIVKVDGKSPGDPDYKVKLK